MFRCCVQRFLLSHLDNKQIVFDTKEQADSVAGREGDLRSHTAVRFLSGLQFHQHDVSLSPGNVEYGCYCAKNERTKGLDKMDLGCFGCSKFFHQDCLSISVSPQPLSGDRLYVFFCRKCNPSGEVESFNLKDRAWKDIAWIALYNLKLEARLQGDEDRTLFHYKVEDGVYLCGFLALLLSCFLAFFRSLLFCLLIVL